MIHYTLEELCDTFGKPCDVIRDALNHQIHMWSPSGFFLAQCEQMDSSRFGQMVILPYGGEATHKTIPIGVFSPRGLASDMSTVVGYILVEDI